MFGTFSQGERHKLKKGKHVVLANGLLYPMVCHIHWCKTSPSRKALTNEGSIFRPPLLLAVR